MEQITLTLTVEEVNSILSVLGELPTKSNAWPLTMKIHGQAVEQLPKSEPVADESAE